MTQQEAEALAERLTRIWTPEKSFFNVHSNNSIIFGYYAFIGVDVGLTVIFEKLCPYCECELSYDGISLLCQFGDCRSETNENDQDEDWQEREQSFAAQWMPFFRRGCWLSGCPVEATAHERIEWIQGFTREDLQSWNLNF